MRLSAKAIIGYCNVNNFTTGNQWTIRAGEPNTLYFQLVDLDQSSLRYLAGIGGGNQPFTIAVTFPSIDDSKVITVNATVNPNDSSIWSLSLSALQAPASGNIRFAITEGSTIRNFSVMNLVSVEYPLNNGSC